VPDNRHSLVGYQDHGRQILEPWDNSLVSLPETHPCCAPRSQRRSVTRWNRAREGEWRCCGTGIRDGINRALGRRPAGPLGCPGGHARSGFGRHVDGVDGTLSEETVERLGIGPGSASLVADGSRRFTPLWRADKTPHGYVVRDANGQGLAYV
jgi:hypothetical protein